MAGVADFAVFDEPYRLSGTIARMDYPDLKEYSVAWTRVCGKGQVYYFSLAHTEEAFETAGFRLLLANSVEWARDVIGLASKASQSKDEQGL